MCKTMVFVQEGLQFSLFPGTPKKDFKSDPKALQMAPKMHEKVIWSHTKKNTTKKALKTNTFSTFWVFKPSKPPLMHINIIFDVESEQKVTQSHRQIPKISPQVLQSTLNAIPNSFLNHYFLLSLLLSFFIPSFPSSLLPSLPLSLLPSVILALFLGSFFSGLRDSNFKLWNCHHCALKTRKIQPSTS